jgi:transposase
VNQLRAFFLERGLIVRAGRAYLWRALPEVMTQAEQVVSPLMFRLLRAIVQQWRELEAQIEDIGNEIDRLAQSDDASICRQFPELGL